MSASRHRADRRVDLGAVRDGKGHRGRHHTPRDRPEELRLRGLVQATIASGRRQRPDASRALALPECSQVIWSRNRPAWRTGTRVSWRCSSQTGRLSRPDRRARSSPTAGDRAPGAALLQGRYGPSRMTWCSPIGTPVCTSPTRSIPPSTPTPTRATSTAPSPRGRGDGGATYRTPAYHNNPWSPTPPWRCGAGAG